MKSIKLRYGNRDWEIVISSRKENSSTIELWSMNGTERMQYGVVTLSKDPKSCAITVQRNNMPYTIMRSLFQVVEIEIKRLGVKFELEMY